MTCPGIKPASYPLRLAIALDSFIALTWRYAAPGVTMSSRFGTAAAHGHRYGVIASWLLDHARWLGFGIDPTTRESHCIGAFRGDCNRAISALWEILGDPVVVQYGGLENFEPEIQAALKARARRLNS